MPLASAGWPQKPSKDGMQRMRRASSKHATNSSTCDAMKPSTKRLRLLNDTHTGQMKPGLPKATLACLPSMDVSTTGMTENCPLQSGKSDAKCCGKLQSQRIPMLCEKRFRVASSTTLPCDAPPACSQCQICATLRHLQHALLARQREPALLDTKAICSRSPACFAIAKAR